VFCATTAGGVMPASRVNGRILSNDRPGPVSVRIRQLYWDLHRDPRHRTPLNFDDVERPFMTKTA
jgi:branched-chain amino acid aminotransferase